MGSILLMETCCSQEQRQPMILMVSCIWTHDMAYVLTQLRLLTTHPDTWYHQGKGTERHPTCTTYRFADECPHRKGVWAHLDVIALSCGHNSDIDPGRLKHHGSLSLKALNHMYVVVLGLVDSMHRSSCRCTALTQILVDTGGPLHCCQNGRPVDGPSWEHTCLLCSWPWSKPECCS